MSELQHGSHALYARGCRCESCVSFRRAYDRDRYRQQHPASMVARLAAVEQALREVRDAHTPDPDDPHGMGYLEGGGYDRIENVCRICGTSDEYAVPWPCWTYSQLDAALSRALLEGSEQR